MFDPITSKLDIQRLEGEVQTFWKENDIFQKSMENRKGGPKYVFYEGPPTANGKPGTHHVLARSFKDIFPRYKTMRGHYALRRGGWDTHGLPVEIEVEKQLGFNGKEQIEAYGVAEFNEKCRQSAFEYIQDWERLTERIAFWADMDTAYVTYENEYIESVWWILKQMWDKDLIYQGFKVVPYCARCGTPLSDHEVALGYQENTIDPSVFVRFPLKDEAGTSLLVWTTTPWTLPANVAVSVHPDVIYATVERETEENGEVPSQDGGTERLILAKELLPKVFGEEPYKVISEQPGKKLKGKRYQPLFTFLPFEEDAHYVVLADFVTTTDGTGVVHQAPAFGMEDMDVARECNLPILMTVDDKGRFIDAVTPWRGMWVKDADPHITQDLDDRGLLFRAETYSHTYPFCWRCGTALLYFARNTWYIATTRYHDQLVDLNQTINWYPNHIKNGRFGNWLDNNVDWALGRERYWGTPLPIWVDDDGDTLMVGSVGELSELAGRDLSSLDLHRPYVDEITFANPKSGKTMRRIPELIDVWFDSGAMPLAQWHYPFENADKFEEQFPADYICEAVDQTRGWFYSLHAISTLLFEDVSFRNCVCLGLILDGEGRKMSKSKGNIVDPWEVLDAHGADAFRWYLYTASPPGQERRFSADLVGEVVRSFTLTLWNTYSFFVTYANLDGWQPGTAGDVPTPEYNELDRWALSALHALVRDVTEAYENYDVTGATRPIEQFVSDLSNWYVRRSRRRFWKSGEDADKQAAYATLYECLVTLSKLLAPSMPFIADALYRNLVVKLDPTAAESVHVSDWPEQMPASIDDRLNAEMRTVQKLASLGHGARQRAGQKVRQPLAVAAFWLGSAADDDVLEKYGDLLADELNVKEVRLLDSASEAADYALHPLPRQLGQKHGSKFPSVRAALAEMDATLAARELLNGRSISVAVNGDTVEVLPDEVEVRLTAHAGFAVAEEGGLIAALVTDLTPELVREGLAREIVRRIQELRKSSGFDISDRINVTYQASAVATQAMEAHREYIMGETLALSLDSSDSLAGEHFEELSLGSETLQVTLSRA